MIYSCFNEKAGHYEYFEDDRGHALNGDLPVPILSKLRAGSVGVPARDAGRALPSGARRVGTGWAARGMIVQCRTSPLKGIAGLGSDALDGARWIGIGVAAVAAVAAYELYRRASR